MVKISSAMCVDTPIEDYVKSHGLLVKREDLSCPPPGPPFSKTRGVYARIRSVPHSTIGVLDTFHSQAGHAVARACQLLGKKCVNYYPVYAREKDEKGDHQLRLPQLHSRSLGATLHGLPAGRSCILYHAAKKLTEEIGGYMMPNALKLEESVEETRKQCVGVPANVTDVLVPSSSGTIASGVIRGLETLYEGRIRYWIHLGYDRSEDTVRRYLEKSSGVSGRAAVHLQSRIILIKEGYSYKDTARPGEVPDWPCNQYYDLKAYRWFKKTMEDCAKKGLRGSDSLLASLAIASRKGNVLFWNIG